MSELVTKSWPVDTVEIPFAPRSLEELFAPRPTRSSVLSMEGRRHSGADG